LRIGVFDSGVGGLTVLRAIREKYKDADLYYLGDTARVPYGTRSKETVIRYSLECAEFLMSKEVDLLVIACNTASSYATEKLMEELPVPVVGVVEPGVKTALERTRGRVGVIGTRATINSGTYQNYLKQHGVSVISKPCPLFVPLVEEGITEGPVAEIIVEDCLKEFKDKEVDTLILGCTHYPLLKKVISSYLKGIAVIDSSEAVAKEILPFVKDGGEGRTYLNFTDDSQNLPNMIEKIFGRRVSYSVVSEVPKS